VSTSELERRPDGGRSNGVQPSLSSASMTCGAVVQSTGVGAPRKLHGPARVRRISSLHQTWPRTCIGPVCVCPDPELRQGLDLPVLVMLPTVMHSTAEPSEPRRFRALLDARSDSSASSNDLCCQRGKHYPAMERMSSPHGLDFLDRRLSLSAHIDDVLACAVHDRGSWTAAGQRHHSLWRVRRCRGRRRRWRPPMAMALPPRSAPSARAHHSDAYLFLALSAPKQLGPHRAKCEAFEKLPRTLRKRYRMISDVLSV
jgi:hypothetical protein